MPPKTKRLTAIVAPDPAAAERRPIVLADDVVFAAALDGLHELDPALMATMREAGCLPRLRRREAGFRGLAAIIVAQQVSTASANAIFARLDAGFPRLDAAAVLGASDEDLRACGLSAGKARTLRAIAAAEQAGELDFVALAHADAEEAHMRLCAIKGIGPWTADIFLLFCLGNADAWPVGDLAVQEGARLALGLDTRPDPKQLKAMGERWRPLRGVVAHCLWAYYGHKRARPATLETTMPRKAATQAVTAPRKKRIS